MKYYAFLFMIMGSSHNVQSMEQPQQLSRYQQFFEMAPQEPVPMEWSDTPHLFSSDFVASPPPLSLSPASEPIDQPTIPDFATIAATILVKEHNLSQQNAENSLATPKKTTR